MARLINSLQDEHKNDLKDNKRNMVQTSHCPLKDNFNPLNKQDYILTSVKATLWKFGNWRPLWWECVVAHCSCGLCCVAPPARSRDENSVGARGRKCRLWTTANVLIKDPSHYNVGFTLRPPTILTSLVSIWRRSSFWSLYM